MSAVGRDPAGLRGVAGLAHLFPPHSVNCDNMAMVKTITWQELSSNSSDVMRTLGDGHTFIVTRHGEPVAELHPIRRNRFVDTQRVREVFGEAPQLDADAFRCDIDLATDQSIEPRN